MIRDDKPSMIHSNIPKCLITDCDDTIPAPATNNFNPEARYGFQGLDDSISYSKPMMPGAKHVQPFKADDDAPRF